MHLTTASERELHKNLCNDVFKGTCRNLFSAEQHAEVAVTLKTGARKTIALILCDRKASQLDIKSFTFLFMSLGSALV